VTDREPEAVEVRYRHAIWSGGRAMLVVCEATTIGEAWWLVSEERAPAPLVPFRYGMLRGRAR
jgi:hypothetical protein